MTDTELLKQHRAEWERMGREGLGPTYIERIKAEHDARIQSLTADLDRAKEALRPFAAIGEMANFAFAPALFQDADTIKKLPWRDGEEEVTITFGNVRHAAFTLKDISHD